MFNTHLSEIQFLDVPTSSRGGFNLKGESFSIYRSDKGRGVTFSNDIAKDLINSGHRKVQIGTTVTGHILFFFSDKGTHVTVNHKNAAINSKPFHDALVKVLEIKEQDFRKAYKLKKGTEEGYYFIDGEL